MMTYGSVCTGYEGIGLGLSLVEDIDIRWQAEIDPHASKILTARFPEVPNLGDITSTDWTAVEPVDIFTAGYPCQPFSHAGLRKGTDDPRHIWPHIATAVGALRPRLLLLENVAGHLTLGLAAVLGDLAALGYDATWGVVRAADAGAPHGRARVFILAADADDERHERHGRTRHGRRGLENDHLAPADTCGSRLREHAGEPSPQEARPQSCDKPASDGAGRSAANAASDGRNEGWPESARLIRGSDAPERGAATTDGEGGAWRIEHGDGEVDWGQYRPAIRRWERISGRPAPRPTEPGSRGGERLSPAFVEWLMGLPHGWVTDIDISRNEKLKALGNGVVPQQCALAYSTLRSLAVAA